MTEFFLAGDDLNIFESNLPQALSRQHKKDTKENGERQSQQRMAVQEPNWKDTQGTSKPSRNPTAWIRPLTGAMTPQIFVNFVQVIVS